MKMKRPLVGPSPAELQEDGRLYYVQNDQVYAATTIMPFTRVAVCAGRLYGRKEHTKLFGADGWAHATAMGRPKTLGVPGYVVSPGMPGGALDPKFVDTDTYGVAAFLTPVHARRGKEPVCIGVMNVQKKRKEFWVGRHGAHRDELLTVCADSSSDYVITAHMARPVSFRELAHKARATITTPNILALGAAFDPYAEHATMPPVARANKTGVLNLLKAGLIINKNDIWTDNVDFEKLRHMHDLQRSNMYHSVPPSSKPREGFPYVAANGITRYAASMAGQRAYQTIASRYLERLIRRKCTPTPSASEAVDLLTKFVRHYGITPRTTWEDAPDWWTLLHLASRLAEKGSMAELVDEQADALYRRRKQLMPLLPPGRGFDDMFDNLADLPFTHDPRTRRVWLVALARLLVPKLCGMAFKRTARAKKIV